MAQQLRVSPLPVPHYNNINTSSSSSSSSCCFRLCINRINLRSRSVVPQFQLSSSGGNGIGGWSGGGGGGGGDQSDDSSSPWWQGFGILGVFLSGWRSRVAADPQFPFKVLMEELVGVSANVLGDMASRPNFGLNELELVFSTLVVGSIVNFTLMYILAPTASASAAASHMFEAGPYSVSERLGTFVSKGLVFAGVGLAAGLAGTMISNGLTKKRAKAKTPPTMLNALTWAAHMGLSANLRYQALNGLEFMLAKGLPPLPFKASVVALRTLNNLLGGVTFVAMARFTGAQSNSNSD